MATIDTLPPSMDTNTSAVFQFEVINDGNEQGDELWTARVGYKPHSSSEWKWSQEVQGAGEGVYQLNVTGLYPNTLYDAISLITNSVGTAYGDIERFRIDAQPVSLSVTTLPARNITLESGELGLLLLDDGDPSVVSQAEARLVYWSTDEQQRQTEWFAATEGQQSYATLRGLEPGTTYWFYAQAKNSTGEGSGDTLYFKTLPDPNSVPMAFNPDEPDTLLIQNFVKVFQTDLNYPHNNQGSVTYTERAGDLTTLDPNDVLYSLVPGTSKASRIVSLLSDMGAEGAVPDFYELAKDARPELADPNDPKNLILLELSIYSDQANPDPDTTSENVLKFWLPNDANSAALKSSFNGKSLTLQQISSYPNEPSLAYPLWDIRRIIEENGRELSLDKLDNQKPNIPYAFFELSTSRELLDINEDKKIDSSDYALLAKDVGKTGIFRSDIASFRNREIISGIPDGRVDQTDDRAFIEEYNRLNPENPLANPYESLEDFESGQIREPFTAYGNAPWIISTDSHEGDYGAKSGAIGDSEASTLEANVYASSGSVSFWMRVSSEQNFDNLRFYIDDVEAGRWSGLLDWQEVNFETTPGTHNFKWVYQKDHSTSLGEDAAYIDNAKFF